MRSRIIAGSLRLLGVLAAGTIAASGDGVAPRQWATANFTGPVLVTDQMPMGPYLIVHDDAKMERGYEACRWLARVAGAPIFRHRMRAA